MKILLIVLAVIVVAVVIGAYLLISNIDSMVADLIEKRGSEATGTAVTVSGVEISLGEGSGSIDGLAVASPEGYDADEAFSFENITVDIDVQSVRSDPIVLDEVRIIAPLVNVEAKESGMTNIDEIRRNIEEMAGDGGEPAGEQQNIRIDRFVMERGRIEFDGSDLGIEHQSIDLPGLTMENVGGETGSTGAEIARTIMKALVRQVTGQIASSRIEDLMKEKLGDDAAEKAKGLLDKITE